MRGPQVVLLLGVAIVAGLGTGSRLLILIAIILAVLLVIALIYRFLAIGDVQGERLLLDDVVIWGQRLQQRISIHNRSRLSIPSIRVTDQSTLPEILGGFVTQLRAKRNVTWEVDIPCRHRGRYQIGPITVHMSDPFGLFPTKREVGQRLSFLVLPRWVAIRRCALKLDGLATGEIRGRLRGEAPPHVNSIREYVPGDSQAAIHWPSVARTGRMMTKLYAPEVQTRLWLAVDLDGAMASNVEELLVTAATSLGLYALRQGNLQVGLVASGAVAGTLQAGRGNHHQYHLQEILAEIHPGTKVALSQAFLKVERHIQPGHVIILFTRHSPEQWHDFINRMVSKSVAVRVVQVIKDEVSVQLWSVPSIQLPLSLNEPMNEMHLIAALEQLHG